jgi:polyphosphate kinase
MLKEHNITDADFLNAPLAVTKDEGRIDMDDPRRFFNRELSWLSFDWRVLEEAQNPHIPLLERVRFLSISGSNLDEFYSVRVAALRSLDLQNVYKRSHDGRTPREQLDLIELEVDKIQSAQQDVWLEIVSRLQEEGIEILGVEQLKKADKKTLEALFFDGVFPVLTPLAIDPAHPFPFIPNGEFALAIELERARDGVKLDAVLPVPHQLDRFIRLKDSKKGVVRFLPLEALLEMFLPQIFPGYVVKELGTFRLLRDSDIEVEDEAEDLVREFETALKRRRRGDVIRLVFSENAAQSLRDKIKEALGASPSESATVTGFMGIADVKEILVANRPDLSFRPYTPRVPERVQDYEGDIFAAIRQKDMLLHHPYETFDTVVRFLQCAARDPDVLAIKQTLYRTSSTSPIVEALCEAAENGKSVTALVELKARFDEARNIQQSRKLERAGAQVVYGFMEWKTHAKVSTVVRRENDKLATYTHFGTGNYHPITANFYTDLSLFTCDPDLGRDATKVFNYVSGYATPEGLENLAIAPLYMKSRLVEMLEQEADHARAGNPAHVWAKMNALVEPDVIDALYRASQAGVRIELVIRSICGLRPGIAGLSENIRVKSVVGRFLEHSRIVCFGNGHRLPSSKARVFMSSADWMGRNLNRRVETLVEIKNPTVHAQIVDQIMAANLHDQAQSWVLQPDGTYLRHNAGDRGDWFNCHKFFMENPSMSGRGRAAVQGPPSLTHSKEPTDQVRS